jgi:cell division protein FtsB
MNRPPHTTSEFTVAGWLASLLFWLAVLAAAGMYALVALSPKVLAWHEERERWRSNQERLVRLERKVHYLKQVAQALESDPEFAAELARVELNASRPGDERLPVEGRLSLAAETKTESGKRESEQGTPDSAFRLPLSTLRDFADDARLRRWMLLAAAGLVVFAFTFLHVSPVRGADSEDDSAGGSWLAQRYGAARGRCHHP